MMAVIFLERDTSDLKKHILVIIIPFPSPMCPFLTPLVYATVYPLDKERSRRVFSPNPVKGVAKGRGSRGAHDPPFVSLFCHIK